MSDITTIQIDDKRTNRIHVDRLPRTEFGMPRMDDMTTIDEWWNLRDDHALDECLNTSVVLADLTGSLPACNETVNVEGIREPDMYDEGMAIWLTGHAVVYADISLVERLPEVLAAPKTRWNDDGLGWARIHPSSYGVDVDSFYIHNGEPAPHSAQDAWRLLAEAVSA